MSSVACTSKRNVHSRCRFGRSRGDGAPGIKHGLEADILWLPQDHSDNRKLNERALRRISGAMDWREQITQFEQLYAGKVPNRMW